MSAVSAGNVGAETDSGVRGGIAAVFSVLAFLAISGGVGYIPSWLITMVASWLGQIKYEDVWMAVMPWAWPVFGVIAVVVLGYIAYVYIMIIIPIKAVQAGMDDPRGAYTRDF